MNFSVNTTLPKKLSRLKMEYPKGQKNLYSAYSVMFINPSRAPGHVNKSKVIFNIWRTSRPKKSDARKNTIYLKLDPLWSHGLSPSDFLKHGCVVKQFSNEIGRNRTFNCFLWHLLFSSHPKNKYNNVENIFELRLLLRNQVGWLITLESYQSITADLE